MCVYDIRGWRSVRPPCLRFTRRFSELAGAPDSRKIWSTDNRIVRDESNYFSVRQNIFVPSDVYLVLALVYLVLRKTESKKRMRI